MNQIFTNIKIHKGSTDCKPDNSNTTQNFNLQTQTAAVIKKFNLIQTSSLDKLNLMQVKELVKEFLKLPSGFDEFLVLLAKNKQNSNGNSKLIDIQDLVKLLIEGKKDGLNELISLLGQRDDELAKQELGKYISLINKFLPNKQKPDEIIQQLLILYIPYLPLEERYKVILDAEQKKDKENKDKIKKITIIIETRNLGILKIEIIEAANEIFTEIYYSESCSSKIRDMINKQIKVNTGKHGKNLKTNTLKEKGGIELLSRPKIIISNESEISANLLDSIHKISIIINEIDEKTELEKSRKLQLENK